MITTVTLNPSIDKAYYLDQAMLPGTVMRVKETINNAGGKGINVAKNVKLCGAEVMATGFVGGFNGQYLEFLLEERGISSQFTHVQAETRSCINILEKQFGSTEFLEAGSAISEEEVERFMSDFQALLSQTDVVTLSGSLPAGVNDNIYAQLIELTKAAGKQVILDSSGDAFKKGLVAKPTLIKPNEDEIEGYFGVTLRTREEILSYAQKFVEEGIKYVVVSLGADGAVLLHDGKMYHGLPPKIQPVNTVGCGDSMVGALAIGLSKNETPEQCLRYAIAVGTANALSPYTGHFEQEDFERIYQEVQIQVIE